MSDVLNNLQEIDCEPLASPVVTRKSLPLPLIKEVIAEIEQLRAQLAEAKSDIACVKTWLCDWDEGTETVEELVMKVCGIMKHRSDDLMEARNESRQLVAHHSAYRERAEERQRRFDEELAERDAKIERLRDELLDAQSHRASHVEELITKDAKIERLEAQHKLDVDALLSVDGYTGPVGSYSEQACGLCGTLVQWDEKPDPRCWDCKPPF